MKLPNFRLSETQATYSLVLGLMGLGLTFMLSYLVFRGLDRQAMVIPYNPVMGFSRFRPPLIILLTAVSVLLAIAGGIMGFSSLGHRRNNLQGRSWMGLLLGALVIVLAIVLFFAWRRLSEPLIIKT